MKHQLKRFIALCLCIASVAGFIPALPESTTAEAAVYTSYTTIAKVPTQSPCTAMQGMDVDGTYVYCAKVNSDDTSCVIARVHKDSGALTWLTNSATGTKFFSQLGHANDLAVCTINSVKTLFVGTGGAGKGDYSLVRLTFNGTTLNEAGHYNMKHNGTEKFIAGVKVISVNAKEIRLILKSGNHVYTATIPASQTSGDVAMEYVGKLDFSAVSFGGTIRDLSAYVVQGFGYKDNRIFVPMSGNHQASTRHISAIVCFDFEGLKNATLKPDPNMSVWIADTTYAHTFEMESCAICTTDGKLYFGTNGVKSSTDTNHDGIHVLNSFVYNPAMGDSTTGQNYQFRPSSTELKSVTTGASVYNSVIRHLGTVSGNKLSGAAFSTDMPIILKHNDPWILTWESSNWTGNSLFLSTYDTSSYSGNKYLYRRSGSGLIALGYHSDGEYHNYGVNLADHNIDDTVNHKYQLKNVINADGTNMVYLWVDGTKLGAMNNYYIGATSQKKTNSWVSGKDFSFSYIGTPQHAVSCTLQYLQVWTKGNINAIDEPNIFRWETQNNQMTPVSQFGYTNNPVTAMGGSCTDGTYSSYYSRLSRPVVLMHDRPWVMEWKTPSWSGNTMLFSSADTPMMVNASYLYRSKDIVALGYSDGGTCHSYGLKLADFGVSPTAGHTYRLTNKINADGTNMVYLSVDGVELGAMNQYYLGSEYQGSTSNFASGKDFTFPYMGNYSYGLHQAYDYIQVWESGFASEDISDKFRWEISGSSFKNITTDGYTANTANRVVGELSGGEFSDATFRLNKPLVLLHNKTWSISWHSRGNWSDTTAGAFLLSASQNASEVNAPYLYRRKGSEIIGIGYYDGTQNVQYGLRLEDFGIDGTADHDYTLTNKPSADGSNMLYLSVDGVELGAMNQYFIGGSPTGTTGNWLSGKDFTFPYIGTPKYPLTNVTMNYLEVDEGAPAMGHVEFRDWDGTVLSSKDYALGEAVMPPTDPIRPGNAAAEYTFAGWDKPIVPCDGDAVSTATYTTTAVEYTVTFQDHDGTVISTATYHYGDAIAVPADPIRPTDGTYIYTFAGWSPAITDCTGNQTYTATYTAKGIPVLTPNYPTLSFEDQIQLNIYFTYANLDDVALSDMGLLTWSSAQEDGTIDTAEGITFGAVPSGNKYFVRSPGIPAKNMGDTVYFKVYARLSDGTYIYSRMLSYSPQAYALQQITGSSNTTVRALCVAMLNYGAAAQTYFNYQSGSLMNSGITAQQQNYVAAYDEYMIDPLMAVNSDKTVNFSKSGGYSDLHPSVSFEGAFSINYYATPNVSGAGELTVYYWNEQDYDNATALTVDNATGTVTMQLQGSQYVANVAGIAAKELDKTIFVAIVYEVNGVRYCSGVIAYSVGRYLEQIAANTASAAQPLAAAAAVYSYYAKLYFSSLA